MTAHASKAWTSLTAASPTAPVRPLSALLAERVLPVSPTSWLQRTTPPADAAVDASAPVAATPATAPAVAPQADHAAAREAAVAEGRAAGERETEELRGRLAAAIAACERAAATRSDRQAEQLAAAAIAVVEAWLGRAPAADRFTPVIRGWLAATPAGTAAIAYANPADAVAVRAAVGDAALTVVDDPRVALGDLRVASTALEIDHRWDAKLAELRDAIATELSSRSDERGEEREVP